jgi:hypothetical protein
VRLSNDYCVARARLVTGRAFAAVQADAWLREAGTEVGAIAPIALQWLRRAA